MLLALFYIFITIWKIFLKIAADAFSGFINLFAISISTFASSILAWSECTFASAAHVRSDPWEPHMSLHKGKTAIGITSPGCPGVQDWTSHYIQPQTSHWSWEKWREKGNEIKWSLKKFKTPELLLFGRCTVTQTAGCWGQGRVRLLCDLHGHCLGFLQSTHRGQLLPPLELPDSSKDSLIIHKT